MYKNFIVHPNSGTLVEADKCWYVVTTSKEQIDALCANDLDEAIKLGAKEYKFETLQKALEKTAKRCWECGKTIRENDASVDLVLSKISDDNKTERVGRVTLCAPSPEEMATEKLRERTCTAIFRARSEGKGFIVTPG